MTSKKLTKKRVTKHGFNKIKKKNSKRPIK